MDQETKPNGALIGLIVILIILVIGGIYIWQSKVKNALEEKKNAETSIPADNSNVTQEDSATLDALQQDANTTDPNAGVDINSVQ